MFSMKKLCVAVLFVSGLFSVNALDLIILKNGNIIDGKVTEITPTEIKYKRANHLDGPTIVININDVLSIRYENGMTEVIGEISTGITNAVGTTGTANNASATGAAGAVAADARIAPLLTLLNTLPAIPIAGNNLKFEFNGNTWTSKVNNENFSTGTLDLEFTDSGAVLKLRQTHIWPRSVGRTAGRVASLIPGGGTVAGALDTAGNVAGALVGAVEAPGTEIVLEYLQSPRASLRLVTVNNTNNATANTAQTNTTGANTASTNAGATTRTIPDDAVTWQGNGHRYLKVNQVMNWNEADADARARGGYLATITSRDEQRFITELLQRPGNRVLYWLGGYREGRNWKWVTDEPFNYSNWARGEPSNSSGHEDKLVIPRLQIWSANVGQWIDVDRNVSENIGGYIIEWDAE